MLAYPRYWVLQGDKCLGYPSDCMGGVKSQIGWAVRKQHPLPPTNGGTPPLKLPHTVYLGQSTTNKPSTFLAIFMGLSLKQITNIQSVLTLGKHYQVHRIKCHRYVTSVLRVKCLFAYNKHFYLIVFWESRYNNKFYSLFNSSVSRRKFVISTMCVCVCDLVHDKRSDSIV